MDFTQLEKGRWYVVHCQSAPTAHATHENLPQLQSSRGMGWVPPAEAAANALCEYLRHEGIAFPRCLLCGDTCPIEGHIQSARHWNEMWKVI